MLLRRRGDGAADGEQVRACAVVERAGGADGEQCRLQQQQRLTRQAQQVLRMRGREHSNSEDKLVRATRADATTQCQLQ